MKTLVFRTVGSLIFVFSTSALMGQDTSEAKYEEVLQKLHMSLTQITKSLEAVVDEDSATVARSSLQRSAEEFRLTRKQAETLSPPSEEAREKLSKKYRPLMESARKDLVGQVARVQRVPGGKMLLQEIRGVFDKNAE